jgi:glycosyltransferase involved in cell wall biosynthesis
VTLVSVIIPSYNRASFIDRAVQSVLLQTYPYLEVIVVDDGSKDGTRSVLEQLGKTDSRIRCLSHDSNKGAQVARNTGIREARGEWISFLDSDDYWLPQSLELRLRVAEQQQIKVVHSDCEIVREDGIRKPFGVLPLAGRVYRALLTHPGPVFPTLLVAREAIAKIGYLDENIISWQEWDTSIRLARYYKFGFVVEPTFVYDCRGTDTISKNKIRDAAGYEQIVCKHRLAILLHLGPRVLAQHYQIVASRYQTAEDERNARRCMWLSRLWWPFRPRLILQRLRRKISL